MRPPNPPSDDFGSSGLCLFRDQKWPLAPEIDGGVGRRPDHAGLDFGQRASAAPLKNSLRPKSSASVWGAFPRGFRFPRPFLGYFFSTRKRSNNPSGLSISSGLWLVLESFPPLSGLIHPPCCLAEVLTVTSRVPKFLECQELTPDTDGRFLS